MLAANQAYTTLDNSPVQKMGQSMSMGEEA